MFEQAFIHKYDNGRMGPEHQDKELYTEMIMNRWKQLTKNHPKAI
ncbi:MAG: hypothetical protein K0S33_2434 [Bacteroidetes bacterium]|jgi:hypothetical protein|nr:hypothetical protein [Bacteroidota bacterium]